MKRDFFPIVLEPIAKPSLLFANDKSVSIRNLILQLVLLCLMAAPSIGATDGLNQLSEYEQRSGWELLFDGESVDGWRNYKSQTVSDGWTVDDGVLSATKGGGDLITEKKYDNFELSIEYRISKDGNSGLLFHVTEDGVKPWHSGPEVQILDNARKRTKEKSGWLYQLFKPVVPGWSLRARAAAGVEAPSEVDATRPAGEWNHIYLRVCKSQCEVALNGVSYYRFRVGDANWDKLVAKSKFSKFPQFGKAGSGHICLQEHGNDVAFRNIKLRELTPAGEVKQKPIDGKLDLVGEVAFPNLEWDGWEPVDDSGRNQPLRFMELTHVGDERLFAAAQKGQVFVFKNDPDVSESRLFLDINENVAPWRRHNEEGLLGLAFHPNFKDNGYFFVYYSVASENRKSRVSRFKVSENDPNRADAASEEKVIEFDQPFNNHNGGSIAFGPDGYLYIGLGDGGDRNDPLGHGQNLSTFMGSILRIDVNRRENGKAYAIPSDNPFVDTKGARPEIYAFGFRNVWRLGFDAKHGDLWAADVGQDLWEEINIVRRGGNYGWNVREGEHFFGNAELGDVSRPIPPIWEYDHRIGKSITGGRVYNSSRIAELTGKYLYADYVTGRVWALEYDRNLQKVTKNLEISAGGIPVTAFGEDPNGEVYYMIAAANGQCIYRFTRK